MTDTPAPHDEREALVDVVHPFLADELEFGDFSEEALHDLAHRLAGKVQAAGYGKPTVQPTVEDVALVEAAHIEWAFLPEGVRCQCGEVLPDGDAWIDHKAITVHALFTKAPTVADSPRAASLRDALTDMGSGLTGNNVARFDRELAAYTTDVREQVAETLEQGMTEPPTHRGHDFLDGWLNGVKWSANTARGGDTQ